MIVLSLQSGTSADGIDVAVVEISRAEEGSLVEERGFETAAALPPRPADVTMRVLHADTLDWAPDLRARALAATAGEPLTAGAFCELDTRLGQAFADAAAAGSRTAGVVPDLVVSHGQTIFHWVDGGRARGTLQLGEPAWIAEAVGAPVLSDLRAADIAAGGEGAPLMAVFDRDGGLAASGRVDAALLAELLRHPYFAAPVPKTTGRETFTLGVVDRAVAAVGASAVVASGGAAPATQPALEDLVATLTELTARTVVDAIPGDPTVLIASGGGARNPVLLGRITALAAERGIAVESSDARGIDPSFKESLMFALLGYLSWHGVPAQLSSGGSGEPRVAGRFTRGRMPLRLPPPLAGVASVSITSTDHGGAPR